MRFSETYFKRGKGGGFSFVEVMFVVLIAGFISIGLCNFIVDSAKALYTSTEKNDIAGNIRQFTGEMESVAKSSNTAYIYKSFNLTDRDAPADRLHDGQSGDFCLFITIQADPAGTANSDLITRVVGYFRKPDPNDPQNEGPVYKFTHNYPTSGAGTKPGNANTPESLIAGDSYNGTYDQVIQLSKGLSNGSLFYDFLDKSVMVKAQIVHGNIAKRVTDTYNFTVTPRG
jgi:hypothetical protein